MLKAGAWALICPALLNRGVRPKDMVPTMPPFSRLRKLVFLGWKNIVSCRLEQGTVNVCVFQRSHSPGGGGGGGGFLFSVTHLMRHVRVPLRLEISIKGLQGNGFFCSTNWFLNLR